MNHPIPVLPPVTPNRFRSFHRTHWKASQTILVFIFGILLGAAARASTIDIDVGLHVSDGHANELDVSVSSQFPLFELGQGVTLHVGIGGGFDWLIKDGPDKPPWHVDPSIGFSQGGFNYDLVVPIDPSKYTADPPIRWKVSKEIPLDSALFRPYLQGGSTDNIVLGAELVFQFEPVIPPPPGGPADPLRLIGFDIILTPRGVPDSSSSGLQLAGVLGCLLWIGGRFRKKQ